MKDPGIDKPTGISQAFNARIIIPRERIAARVAELAVRIAQDMDDTPLTLAAVMTGSIIFVSDLIRQLPIPMMKIRLVSISSYPGTATQSQGVQVLTPLTGRFDGQQVLLVDDILDSGRTLATAVEQLRQVGAESVKTCVLLRKPSTRRAPAGMDTADYVGFDIEDQFVVGYGLDHGDYYRNLPDIAVLKELTSI